MTSWLLFPPPHTEEFIRPPTHLCLFMRFSVCAHFVLTCPDSFRPVAETVKSGRATLSTQPPKGQQKLSPVLLNLKTDFKAQLKEPP